MFKEFMSRLIGGLVGVFLFFGTVWVAELATRFLLTLTGGN